jgi:hypothetical protein
MWRRWLVVVLPGLLLGAGALVPARAAAETLVESNMDSRIVVALRMPRQSAVQTWLPAPWKVEPIASGPSATANVLMVFIERILSQDADGKPIPGGNTRAVAVVVPARNPETGESSMFVVQVFSAAPGGVPGPYKNSVPATVTHEQSSKNQDATTITGEEAWEMREAEGKTVELRFVYERGAATRVTTETHVRSAVDPTIHRIYRVDQGVDILKSGPAGVEHVRNLQFRVNAPALTPVLDGSERIVSIAMLPWYIRQVFVP